jgi:hypothetical protein
MKRALRRKVSSLFEACSKAMPAAAPTLTNWSLKHLVMSVANAMKALASLASTREHFRPLGKGHREQLARYFRLVKGFQKVRRRVDRGAGEGGQPVGISSKTAWI